MVTTVGPITPYCSHTTEQSLHKWPVLAVCPYKENNSEMVKIIRYASRWRHFLL